MRCHICNEPAVGQCRVCARGYCSGHGNIVCRSCVRRYLLKALTPSTVDDLQQLDDYLDDVVEMGGYAARALLEIASEEAQEEFIRLRALSYLELILDETRSVRYWAEWTSPLAGIVAGTRSDEVAKAALDILAVGRFHQVMSVAMRAYFEQIRSEHRSRAVRSHAGRWLNKWD